MNTLDKPIHRGVWIVTLIGRDDPIELTPQMYDAVKDAVEEGRQIVFFKEMAINVGSIRSAEFDPDKPFWGIFGKPDTPQSSNPKSPPEQQPLTSEEAERYRKIAERKSKEMIKKYPFLARKAKKHASEF